VGNQKCLQGEAAAFARHKTSDIPSRWDSAGAWRPFRKLKEWEFDIDANGIYAVSAKELAPARNKDFHPRAADFKEEIEKSSGSRSPRRRTRRRRKRSRSRTTADNLAYQCEKQLKGNRARFPATRRKEEQVETHRRGERSNEKNDTKRERPTTILQNKFRKFARKRTTNGVCRRGPHRPGPQPGPGTQPLGVLNKAPGCGGKWPT